MVKNLFFAIAKFVLFLLVYAAGSFFPPFHLEHVIGTTADGMARIFIWDGLLLSTLVFAVILGIEAARKRINITGPWTVVAFLFAVVLGYAAKLGFLTRS